MKTAVIYSSKTGNTQKIAQAIHQIMPQTTPIYPFEQVLECVNYDFLAIGFWVDKGQPDEKMAAFMRRIKGCRIGLFATLGAWPDSDHAKGAMAKATELLAGNIVVGSFICQGRVDPEHLAKMAALPEEQQRRPMTPEKIARLKEAEKHPNEQDCLQAQRLFKTLMSPI